MKIVIVITTISFLGGAAFLSGCSKNAAPEPTVGTPAVAAEAAPLPDNPMIAAELEALNRQVQQRQYEAAVGALMTLSQMPKSDKQEAMYRARLRETETELLKQAQAGDQAAAQSAQMLGRMMTGR